MDRRAWQATVHRVAKNRTRLKWLSTQKTSRRAGERSIWWNGNTHFRLPSHKAVGWKKALLGTERSSGLTWFWLPLTHPPEEVRVSSSAPPSHPGCSQLKGTPVILFCGFSRAHSQRTPNLLPISWDKCTPNKCVSPRAAGETGWEILAGVSSAWNTLRGRAEGGISRLQWPAHLTAERQRGWDFTPKFDHVEVSRWVLMMTPKSKGQLFRQNLPLYIPTLTPKITCSI